MANPSLSGEQEALAAESEAERKTQMALDRKELAKYKDTYKRFWMSVFTSVVSFLMTFVLLLSAFLLRRKNPTKAWVYVECSVWWIILFVLNTPRHMRVYGWFPPRDPRFKTDGA